MLTVVLTLTGVVDGEVLEGVVARIAEKRLSRVEVALTLS